MERKLDERLEEIKASGTPIYSISRLDCINRCLYEAYRTYKLGDRGGQNIYSSLGGRVHDTLEGITNGTHTELDLLKSVAEEIENVDLAGLSFPKDRNGGDTIREHWIADMLHFCATYHAPVGKNLKAEELFIYETPAGNILQGYIDLQCIRKDGSIDIYDYKTSSMYQGDALKEHSRQLITYALGKEQEGYTVHSAAFIFLKYAEVTYYGKKTSRSKEETQISKCIERCKIGYELSGQVEVDLTKAGYDDIEIEGILAKFKRSNMLDDLPAEIRDKYQIKPYVLSVDLSEENKQETISYIDSTVRMWEALGEDEENYPPKKFTRIQKNGKEVNNCFFCTQLCGHFKNCPFIQDHLKQIELNKKDDEEDMFA